MMYGTGVRKMANCCWIFSRLLWHFRCLFCLKTQIHSKNEAIMWIVVRYLLLFVMFEDVFTLDTAPCTMYTLLKFNCFMVSVRWNILKHCNDNFHCVIFSEAIIVALLRWVKSVSFEVAFRVQNGSVWASIGWWLYSIDSYDVSVFHPQRQSLHTSWNYCSATA